MAANARIRAMNRSMEAILEEDVRAVVQRDLPWERLSGCRVVVTGAGGFLGSHLARALLGLWRLGKVSTPLEVVAVVRDVERARRRFDGIADSEHLTLLPWDLNAIAVPDLGDVQYVVHAASQASPRFYGSDPVGTLLPNTVGTAALLEALRRSADPRGFMFVSSSEIYGALSSCSTLAETSGGHVDPATLRACYAESKRVGETMCVAWNKQFGLPTFIVRPFHTYGPGLTAEDGRVFADFAFNVMRNENIVMTSDGTSRRAFCYASDAVAGFLAVLLQGEVATPYNVANSNAELSVMELAELMVALYPELGLHVERRGPSSAAGYLPNAVNRIVPDTTRLQALGWQALVDPHHGFRRMIDAHRP
jgi:UDP-glucuronate decarboxylase